METDNSDYENKKKAFIKLVKTTDFLAYVYMLGHLEGSRKSNDDNYKMVLELLYKKPN